MPKLTCDAEANAAYVRFLPEQVEESVEIPAGIVLDYDAEGSIVGMDVLDARGHLSPDLLDKAA